MSWIEIDKDDSESSTTKILPFGNGVLVKVCEKVGYTDHYSRYQISIVYVPIDKESINKEVKYHETSERT